MLFDFEEYCDCSIDEFEAEHPEIYELWEKTVTPEMTESFLQTLYHNTNITEIAESIPHGKTYSKYAKIFMYHCVESMLEEKNALDSRKFPENIIVKIKQFRN